MYLRDLQLVDFRNYGLASLQLQPGITAIIGRNGHGKTNLIEAIGYLSTGRSHRVATDIPLIAAGKDRGRIVATIDNGVRPVHLDVTLNAGAANTVKVNRAGVKRSREALGHLRSVVFAPEDLALVKGSPSGRRRFLDDLLVQLAPKFSGIKSDYERVVKQRNALLKQGRRSWSSAGDRRGGSQRVNRESSEEDAATVESTLAVWDEQLVRYGAELVSARLYLLDKLAPHVAVLYSEVSENQGDAELAYRCTLLGRSADISTVHESADDTTFDELDSDGLSVSGYRSIADIAEAFRARLHECAHEERRRGVTLVGPHRDDVELFLGGLPAKGYASQGESWSFALTLRLASYLVMRDEGVGELSQREPILILDDVFAELDARRRSQLVAIIDNAEQVIVTSAVETDVPPELEYRRVIIDSGTVTVEDNADGGELHEE